MISARSSNTAASKMTNSMTRIKDSLLFKNLDGKYLTLQDFVAESKKEDTAEAVKETEKHRKCRRKAREKKLYYLLCHR